MEGKFNDLELLFIREVLDQHGEYLSDLFTEDIENKKLIDSEALIDSIGYKVSSYGIDPVLTFNFLGYGRAIEIRWHKRSNNTKNWVTDTNKEVWGINSRKKRKKKNTLWYARNLYGSQNRLISMLSYELTNEERARLKNILDKQQIQIAL